MKEIIVTLLTHPIFISVFFVWLLAGIIKYSFSIIRKEGKSFGYELFRTGGMPSAHAGTVTAVVVNIYFLEGLSNLFFVSCVFAIIIIRDAFGVRWSVGEQAKVINRIIKHDHMHELVKVVMGHTLTQTVMGILLGFLIASLVHLL